MVTKEQRNKIVVEQKKFVNYLDKNNLRLTKARIEVFNLITKMDNELLGNKTVHLLTIFFAHERLTVHPNGRTCPIPLSYFPLHLHLLLLHRGYFQLQRDMFYLRQNL